MYSAEYLELGRQRLNECGFPALWLADIEAQDIHVVTNNQADQCRYSTDPNYQDAGTVLLTAPPFSTSLDDENIQVRNAALQKGLGKDFQVVSGEYYNPSISSYPAEGRKALARGDYSLFYDRMFRIIEVCAPDDERDLVLYGFSLPADIVAGVAHQNLYAESKGSRPIKNLGVYAPARSHDRGPTRVIRAARTAGAFMTSGQRLWDNVLASDSPALLEARGIDLSKKMAKTRHDLGLAAVLGRYVRKDARGVTAGFAGSGFASTRQLMYDISIHPDAPESVYARMVKDRLTKPDFAKGLTESEKLWIEQFEGLDHAAADSLANNLAFAFQTARYPLPI